MTGGHWIAASKALNRVVPINGPYPHICGRQVAGKDAVSSARVRLDRRDCAACAHDKHLRTHPPTSDARRPNPMHSADSLREVALAAAARGWHVFPLRPDDKRPAFPDHPADACTGRDPRCRAGHVGWEARATTDPERIRRGWASVPYGVGIACGPSRLVVVDLDVRKPNQAPPAAWQDCDFTTGADVLAHLTGPDTGRTVDPTYTVTTGRGGTHLYYRHPDTGPKLRTTAGAIGWLIDTRSHGGYVVAAGSTVNGRPYTVALDTEPAPLPDWLAALLEPAPLPPQRPVVVDLGTGRQAAYLEAAIGRQLDHLRQAAEGERNHRLYVSAVALGQLAAGGAIAEDQAAALLEETALSIGLTRFETLRTIRSGLAAGARRPRTVAA